MTRYLFCDGSVDTTTKIGFGAHLFMNQTEFEQFNTDNITIEIKKFTKTSSTRLELENLLHCLKTIDDASDPLIIYTDSQNIAGLLKRRKRLETQNFISKRKNQEIKNATLYKEFYHHYDRLKFKIVQLKGHKRSINKEKVDLIFSMVDKAARKVLRENN